LLAQFGVPQLLPALTGFGKGSLYEE